MQRRYGSIERDQLKMAASRDTGRLVQCLFMCCNQESEQQPEAGMHLALAGFPLLPRARCAEYPLGGVMDR